MTLACICRLVDCSGGQNEGTSVVERERAKREREKLTIIIIIIIIIIEK
jgi:hypothetical protein